MQGCRTGLGSRSVRRLDFVRHLKCQSVPSTHYDCFRVSRTKERRICGDKEKNSK